LSQSLKSRLAVGLCRALKREYTNLRFAKNILGLSVGEAENNIRISLSLNVRRAVNVPINYYIAGVCFRIGLLDSGGNSRRLAEAE
jgi:BioD-like phosphotransacetylase family protein